MSYFDIIQKYQKYLLFFNWDVAVADEKYFNHSYYLLLFALKCPVLQGFSGVCEMRECIMV